MGIDFFINKTGRIRGETMHEKLQFLIDRYEHVAIACKSAVKGNSADSYRKFYYGAHSRAAEELKMLKNANLIEKVAEKRDFYLNSYNNCSNNAFRDSYGYFYAELSAIIDDLAS